MATTLLSPAPARRLPVAQADKTVNSCTTGLWQSEADMLPEVLQHRALLAPGSGWHAFFEVPGPQGGIVDLVLVRFSRAALADRTPDDAVMDDLTAIRVVQALATGVAGEELSRYTGVSRAHLTRRVLPRLREAGWIQRDGRQWVPVRRFRPVVTKVIAVELKRHDWRTALKQAARHRAASDASWVVLDARRSGAAVAAGASFAHAGIGLCGLSRMHADGTGGLSALDVIHPPEWNQSVDLAGRAFFGEQCLTLLRSGTRSGPERLVFGRRSRGPSDEAFLP